MILDQLKIVKRTFAPWTWWLFSIMQDKDGCNWFWEKRFSKNRLPQVFGPSPHYQGGSKSKHAVLLVRRSMSFDLLQPARSKEGMRRKRREMEMGFELWKDRSWCKLSKSLNFSQSIYLNLWRILDIFVQRNRIFTRKSNWFLASFWWIDIALKASFIFIYFFVQIRPSWAISFSLIFTKFSFYP